MRGGFSHVISVRGNNFWAQRCFVSSCWNKTGKKSETVIDDQISQDIVYDQWKKQTNKNPPTVKSQMVDRVSPFVH